MDKTAQHYAYPDEELELELDEVSAEEVLLFRQLLLVLLLLLLPLLAAAADVSSACVRPRPLRPPRARPAPRPPRAPRPRARPCNLSSSSSVCGRGGRS